MDLLITFGGDGTLAHPSLYDREVLAVLPFQAMAYAPARLAFVNDLVPKEDLINAVGLNSLLR